MLRFLFLLFYSPQLIIVRIVIQTLIAMAVNVTVTMVMKGLGTSVMKPTNLYTITIVLKVCLEIIIFFVFVL